MKVKKTSVQENREEKDGEGKTKKKKKKKKKLLLKREYLSLRIKNQ